MQRQPLPKQVDARRFATSGVDVTGFLSVKSLPRFVEGLASDDGDADVELHFYRDEQGFYRIDGRASAQVSLLCQRCLQGMPGQVDADFELALVWNDDQAKALPRSLDPVVVGEEMLELAEVVQDELIVSTPYVSYHALSDCPAADAVKGDQGVDSDEAPQRESPFSVLGKLKSPD